MVCFLFFYLFVWFWSFLFVWVFLRPHLSEQGPEKLIWISVFLSPGISTW